MQLYNLTIYTDTVFMLATLSTPLTVHTRLEC